MQDERLRLLALWHGLRRDLDLLLDPLLAHGPVAVNRVSAHLDALSRAFERERVAFEALRRACTDERAPRASDIPAPQDELAAGRARSRPAGEPLSVDLDGEATVIQLPERSPQR